MGKSRKAAYVVFRGRKTGIFRSWDETNAQVNGFPNGKQQGYLSLEAAERDWAEHLKSLLPSETPSVTAGVYAGPKPGENGISKEKPDLKRSFAEFHEDATSIYRDSELTPQSKRFKQVGESQVGAEEKSPERYPAVILTPAQKDVALLALEQRNKNNGEVIGEAIVLNAEQQAVVGMALQRHNIFLTGAGGCGKTATLRKILEEFEKREITCQVVAPTGIAALPLGGKTAYSFLGWKPDLFRVSLTELLKQTKKYVRKAVRRVDVLVIEEISMVENLFLERMNLLFQSILNSTKPFGGKTIIILGDFHQLPPVKPFKLCLQCGREMSKYPKIACEACGKSFTEADKWAFKSEVWKELGLKNIQLQRIHRQKDGRFQDILTKIRNGVLLSEDEWKELEKKKTLPPGIAAVRLLALRKQVDDINTRELGAINKPQKSWEAVDSHTRLTEYMESPWEHDQPLENHRFAKSLQLKIGAKVVLLQNLEQRGGLVNGSQGVVIDFAPLSDIHKDDIIPGERFYAIAERENGKMTKVWRAVNAPVVRFSNGAVRTINPFESSTQYGTKNEPYLATRVQIPLALAWALTIHKSQGMTLQYVEVSKKDLFEAGQLYVALSRATFLEGLTVTGFTREQLPVDPDIVEFYKTTKWEILPQDSPSDSQDVQNLPKASTPTQAPLDNLTGGE